MAPASCPHVLSAPLLAHTLPLPGLNFPTAQTVITALPGPPVAMGTDEMGRWELSRAWGEAWHEDPGRRPVPQPCQRWCGRMPFPRRANLKGLLTQRPAISTAACMGRVFHHESLIAIPREGAGVGGSQVTGLDGAHLGRAGRQWLKCSSAQLSLTGQGAPPPAPLSPLLPRPCTWASSPAGPRLWPGPPGAQRLPSAATQAEGPGGQELWAPQGCLLDAEMWEGGWHQRGVAWGCPLYPPGPRKDSPLAAEVCVHMYVHVCTCLCMYNTDSGFGLPLGVT